MKAISYIADRLTEASSWGAISTVLLGLGITLPPGLWAHVAQTGMALAALAAFLIKEDSAK